jgi:hypothetical protein
MDATAMAALSTDLATQRTQSGLSMAVAKNALDAQRRMGAALVQLLDPNADTRFNGSA